MIKKYTSLIFLFTTMFSPLASASLLITLKGTNEEINFEAYKATNHEIGLLLQNGAVRSYKVSSLDISGTVQICAEFIGCTVRDHYYLDFIVNATKGFEPAPIFEISQKACN